MFNFTFLGLLVISKKLKNSFLKKYYLSSKIIKYKKIKYKIKSTNKIVDINEQILILDYTFDNMIINHYLLEYQKGVNIISFKELFISKFYFIRWNY